MEESVKMISKGLNKLQKNIEVVSQSCVRLPHKVSIVGADYFVNPL